MSQTYQEPKSFTSKIIEVFLEGNLTPLLILLSLVAGAVALSVTPREEEPQIVVPIADVFVDVPGASSLEVERLVSTRLEKLLYQIDGVEYVYSMSRPHQAVITVRFYVGENREASLIKIYNKIEMNKDQLPPQVNNWVVKPVEIDDVPILAATLWSENLDDFVLRRLAEELENRIQAVPNTGRTEIIGGRPRRIRVLLDPDRLESHQVPMDNLRRALQGAALVLPAGRLRRGDQEVVLDAGRSPLDYKELEELVVTVHDGRPVYLRDIATVEDGPDEPTTYTRYGLGAASSPEGLPEKDYAAVTLAVAKKRGTNAVTVAKAVRERLERLHRDFLPEGVHVTITRDYGKTANDKVNELVEGLLVAIVIVTIILAMALGWREALIVATAVPIAFSMTLLINYLTGYTINRVTLFALILALGLVVDDPIVDVENIFRHLRMGKEKPLQAVKTAVNEVRPPIIMATLAVIISFLPMFFITGMMGPYMRPMAFNVPLAMLMSLFVAFTITPWLSYHVLKKLDFSKHEESETPFERTLLYRSYSGTLRPFLHSRSLRYSMLGFTLVLFGITGWLAMTRRVPLKMLPFDNKNELQVVIDMDEGSSLEKTEATAAEMAARLRGMTEVVDVTSYVGTSSPMDFNGLVRHYYLRRALHLADIRVNLLEKHERAQQSHEIALRVRKELLPIAKAHGARIKIVESPPGPPVISTLTVEVYGDIATSAEKINAAAEFVSRRLELEKGVVDVDSSVEARQRRLRYVLDKEKAALLGISTGMVATGLRSIVEGESVTTLHNDSEANPLAVQIRLPLENRTAREDLERITISTPAGAIVSLAEIGSFVEGHVDLPIYHKNLRRVAYVTSELAGRAPAEAIFDLQEDLAKGSQEGGLAPGQIAGLDGVPGGDNIPLSDRSYLNNGAGIPWRLPKDIELSWVGEGEWKITLDAFRDLGLAFAVACLGIYMLLVHETKSYFMPLILMISIPLTIIGIVPGFWLLNLALDVPVAGVGNPIFFTATAMIGMIALAGIAVRNAILLIEFVHQAEDEGLSLEMALLKSGAVRIRPIFLTAGTAMLAAVPITLDPIFSGLAWALIFGLLVSTAFTLIIVPVVYYMAYANRADAADQPAAGS